MVAFDSIFLSPFSKRVVRCWEEHIREFLSELLVYVVSPTLAYTIVWALLTSSCKSALSQRGNIKFTFRDVVGKI